MKLVLCSEGFHTSNTVQACIDLCGKPKDKISFAVINEAYAVERGDKHWVIDNLNDLSKSFPAELDIINLLALSLDEVKDRVMQKDVIFVVGGHTGYLTRVFKKTGFDKLLPELLKTKVYVGSSAGSMVIGKRLSSAAAQKLYGPMDQYDVSEYLGLVDFSIIPHMDSNDFPDRKKKLIEAAKQHNGLIYGLPDDCAVVVNGSSISLIGSQPLILNNR